MGVTHKTWKLKAQISPEGLKNLKELLQVSSNKAVFNYSNLILTRVNKCLSNGLWLSDYFPISREYKVKQLKSFRPLFKNLIDSVFIPYRNKEGNETYMVGKFSKYYRLNPVWLTNYITLHSEIKSSRWKTRDSIYLGKEIKARLHQSLSQLSTFDNDSSLSISLDAAIQISQNLIRRHLKRTGPGCYEYTDTKDSVTRPLKLAPGDRTVQTSVLLYALYLKNIFEQQSANFFQTFRAGYEGRLYHPFLMLPKILYPFIRFRGEHLTEIDLSNSLPLLIVNSILKSQTNPSHYLFNQPSAIRYIENTHIPGTTESFLYESVKRGTFYTDIHKLIQPGHSSSFYQKMKGYVKIKVSEALYGDRNKMTLMKSHLEEHFSSFMTLIHLYKSEAFKSIYVNNDISGYQDLSMRRQKSTRKASNDSLVIYGMRKESILFIDNILPALYTAGIPAIPKHDAIIVPRSYTKRSLGIINSILGAELGDGNYSMKIHEFSHQSDLG